MAGLLRKPLLHKLPLAQHNILGLGKLELVVVERIELELVGHIVLALDKQLVEQHIVQLELRKRPLVGLGPSKLLAVELELGKLAAAALELGKLVATIEQLVVDKLVVGQLAAVELELDRPVAELVELVAQPIFVAASLAVVEPQPIVGLAVSLEPGPGPVVSEQPVSLEQFAEQLSAEAAELGQISESEFEPVGSFVSESKKLVIVRHIGFSKPSQLERRFSAAGCQRCW